MRIELFKMWSEYTDAEKAQLPLLNPEKVANGEVNYMWNGESWEYVPID